MNRLHVHRVGPQALVADLGRPGHAAIGVPVGGAADREALALAHRLVGNARDAAGLEVLLGGLEVSLEQETLVAVTGAPVPVTVDGHPAAFSAPVLLAPGQRLRLGAPTAGLRTYLAVAGGIEVPRLFGSASSSPTLGLGPAPLRASEPLDVGPAAGSGSATSGSDLAAARAPRDAPVQLRVVLGPRDDWFTPDALAALATASWTVTPQADRVGVRLSGPVLTRARPGELPSEGVVRGSVQVPPDGQPIVFGPDHPTTGGYPVVGVVHDADLDALFQARPGAVVRFEVVAPPWRAGRP